MGRERIINEGEVTPVFGSGSAFSKEIAPIEGHILKGLMFYSRGDHDTLITAGGATDGEAAPITELQVEVPRIDRGNPRRPIDPIVWNWRPVDLIHLASQYAGHLIPRANPLADLGVHFSTFFIPFAPPKRITNNYDDWGIPASEINGKIRIRGNYGGLTSIGPSATGIRHRTSISQIVESPNRIPPRACLMGIQNRIPIESDTRHGPLVIQPGAAEAVFQLFLRQHDDSAVSAQRVNGLVTRYIFKMNQVDLIDELHTMLQKKMNSDLSLDAAAIQAGISGHLFSKRGIFGELPQIDGGTALSLTVDTSEEIPVEFANVTPTTADAVYANIVGAKLTSFGRNERGV